MTPTEHRSIKEEVKQGVQKVGNTVKPVLHTVHTGVKTGVHSVGVGLKSGVQGMQSGVKAGVQSVSNMWSALKTRRSTQAIEKQPVEPS